MALHRPLRLNNLEAAHVFYRWTARVILGSASNHRFNMAIFTMTETLGTPLASNGTEDVAPCNWSRIIDAGVLAKINY